MDVLQHADLTAVSDALSKLGIPAESILTAVRQGYFARSNCTANHPPLFPSFVAWGETVRSLRDQLAPLGWIRTNERNYSRTVHPEGRIAIAVATGDEATGIVGQMPCTKSAKGPSTLDALEVNRNQMWLPGLEPASFSEDQETADEQVTTWILLVHHGKDEVRCELSLPVDIDRDGKVGVWRERIIFPAIPLDSTAVELTPPLQPDIDVDVKRKVV